MSRITWRACALLIVAVAAGCTDSSEPAGPHPIAPTSATAWRGGDGPGRWALNNVYGSGYTNALVTTKTEDFSVSLRLEPLGTPPYNGSELFTNLGSTGETGWDLLLLGEIHGDQLMHPAFMVPPTYDLVVAPVALTKGEWHDIEAGRRGGRWFMTIDGHTYDLGTALPPSAIDPATAVEANSGFSSFDGLIASIALNDLATHRTIERFAMEEGSGLTTKGDNGTVMFLQRVAWRPTGSAQGTGEVDDDEGEGEGQGEGQGDGEDGGHAISSCGAVISSPGHYVVTRDLVDCPANGIDIRASDVTLRLNGHIVDGVGPDVGTGINVGAGVPGGVHGVKIVGPGDVRSFLGGITFEGVEHSSVRGVSLEFNRFGVPVNAGYAANEPTHFSAWNAFVGNRFFYQHGHGVTVNGGSNNLIALNQIETSAGEGVLLFAGASNTVRGNIIRGGFDVGIKVEGGNADWQHHLITGNTVLGNSLDMWDGWGDCVHNTWTGNTFASKAPACIQ